MVALVLEHGVELLLARYFEQPATDSHARRQRPVREREALGRVDQDNSAPEAGAPARLAQLIGRHQRERVDAPREPARGGDLADD